MPSSRFALKQAQRILDRVDQRPVEFEQLPPSATGEDEPGQGRRTGSRDALRMPYTTLMRKTSVYLDDEQAERLARLSRAEGRPQAEIIRKAIAEYAPPVNGDRNFELAGCVAGPGDSIADLDVDELMRGFGE
jgi:predicted transcriptional regulator